MAGYPIKKFGLGVKAGFMITDQLLQIVVKGLDGKTYSYRFLRPAQVWALDDGTLLIRSDEGPVWGPQIGSEQNGSTQQAERK